MSRILQRCAVKSVLLFMALIAILVLCSCGGKEEALQKNEPASEETPVTGPHFSDNILDAPGYEGWREYLDEYLIVYCPPDSSLLERVPNIARSIKKVFLENAFRLHIRVPMPIIFYLYNNTTEIEERTDCHNTCVKGNVVHYMLFTPLGEPIMIRLLQDFDLSGPSFEYCYEGLVTLLNYSGENYSELAYIDSFNGLGVPIDSLINDTKYLALDSVRRIKAAASFIQYLIEPPRSPDNVLALYKSDEKPRKALEDIFGQPVPELEKGWHEFIKSKSSMKVEY